VRFLPEDHDRCEIDERALAMTQARIVTPGGTAPAAPPPPAPPPVPDPTQAPDPETDLARTMQEAMAQGNVTWAGNAQVIDARNVPGLRQGQGAGPALIAHDEDGPAAAVQDRLRRAAEQAGLQA
jgi:hypothetical protein